MSGIVAIHVVKKLGGEIVATQYAEHEQNDGWEDPHGGEFSDDEQKQFDDVATGQWTIVTLHKGTQHQTSFEAKLVATLM